MKFPLAPALLLASAYASVWPYHGAIGIASSAGRGFVEPAYSGVPVISYLSTAHARRAPSIASGSALGSPMKKEAFIGPITTAKAKTGAGSASGFITAAAAVSGSIVIKEPSRYTVGPSQGPVATHGPRSAATFLGPSEGARTETAVISAISGNVTNDTDFVAVPAEKVSGPEAKVATSARAGGATETAAMRLSVGTVIIAGPKPGVEKVVSNDGASSSILVGAPTPGQITIFGPSGAPVLIRGASERETAIEGSKHIPVSVIEGNENSVGVAPQKLNLISSSPMVMTAATLQTSAPPTTIVSESSEGIRETGM